MLDDTTRRLIDTALGQHDMAGALALADQALAAGIADPLLYNLAAWRCEEAGDFAGAHGWLDRAMVLAPGNAAIVTAVGSALRKQGRLDAAIAIFDEAISLDAGFAVPWLERGFALDAAGSVDAALASYRRAATLDPSLAPAFAGAAAMAARLGLAADVRSFAAQALSLDPGDAVATTALAVSEIEHGDSVAAAIRLRWLLDRAALGAEDRIAALTALGDALDDPGESFAAYATAKTLFARRHAWRFEGQEAQRAFIDGIAARVARIGRARWHDPIAAPDVAMGPAAASDLASAPARGHVFLLGYPRSGTTLVENILASAPGVEAIEERHTTIDADTEFLTTGDGIDRLMALDAAGVTAFRDAYWARVAASGVDAAGKIFVDMDPLKGIKLPLIARLFPDARIVVVRRDPRDVVWSCFRRNFRVSAAAYAFTTLDETARHYASLMSLMDRCFDRMPLTRHVVRYEDLIGDFDAAIQALCAFAGIDWSPGLRRFDLTAKRRGVTTASATQVRRGLFDGGGQWRRYADQLATVEPILRPWITAFGY